MSDTLGGALVKAQADMPALQRDKINPAFKSKYLSLESLLAEVLPVLNRHGLALVQFPWYLRAEDTFVPALRTTLIHGESGESIETTMLLLAAKTDPQGQGSAITYARRYSLMSMLGLSADEDDDGNAAQPKRAKPKATMNPGAIDAEKITKPQRDRMFAIATKHGVPADKLKAIVREVAGVESSNDIPRAKYDALIAAVEKAGAAA